MEYTNERDSHFFLAGWNGARRDVDATEHFQNASKTAPESCLHQIQEPSTDSQEAAAEHQALRNVYEQARGVLRYDGIDQQRAIQYRDGLIEAIEAVKAIDGGNWESSEADMGNPIAEITSASHDGAEFGERGIRILNDFQHLEYGTKLYAHPAPAEPVADDRAAFEKWYSNDGVWLQSLERNIDGEYTYMPTAVNWNAWKARAALAATPAAAAPDSLRTIAIEELAQLGYTFDGDKMMPPDFVGELMHVVQTAPCGCREGTCETKSDRACRMKAEIAAAAQVVLPEPAATIYTMEALVPGGTVKHHAEVHKALPAGTKLFAEPDVRALLAEVSAPAQAAPSNAEIDALVYEMRQAGTDSTYDVVRSALRRWIAPQAQADARDAERYRSVRDGVKSMDRHLFIYTMKDGCGTKLIGVEADAEIDRAAIAAAKGE